jgi:hypothetical protein
MHQDAVGAVCTIESQADGGELTMLGRIPDTDLPAAAVEPDPADLLPLSHLALDLDAPVTGWEVALPARGIAVRTDDLGRRCILRADARVLLAERAESKARQRAAAERQAVEHAEQWRAQRRRGVPADQIPEGVLPAVAMLQAAKDAAPKRRSVLQEALDNEGALTYYRIRDES